MGGSAARFHTVHRAWELIGDLVDRAAYDARQGDCRDGVSRDGDSTGYRARSLPALTARITALSNGGIPHVQEGKILLF